MTTLTDIKKMYPKEEVDQFQSMQLFIVYTDNYSLLLSYTTIVGFRLYKDDLWLITTKKYSPTTSKQLNKFCYTDSNFTRVDEVELQKYLQKYT